MAKEIPLTKGKKAIVDDSDYEWLMRWSWCFNSNGYAVSATFTGIKGKVVYMHRLIMEPPKGKDIDHINGDGLDNRRSNLRIATRSQNLCNKRIGTRNTSGHLHVSRDSATHKWRVVIVINSKHIHLGEYADLETASRIADQAAEKYHGEFRSPDSRR